MKSFTDIIFDQIRFIYLRTKLTGKIYFFNEI